MKSALDLQLRFRFRGSVPVGNDGPSLACLAEILRTGGGGCLDLKPWMEVPVVALTARFHVISGLTGGVRGASRFVGPHRVSLRPPGIATSLSEMRRRDNQACAS